MIKQVGCFSLAIAFLLTSCTQTTIPSNNYKIEANEATLAEASYAVGNAISDLAETAQARNPPPNLAQPPSPASYGMSAVTSVDWSGPVEPILAQIAESADYRLRVVGTAPGIPIIITVYKKNAMLGDVLRDIGYQSGERAAVVVFPESRVIELRYAKN